MPPKLSGSRARQGDGMKKSQPPRAKVEAAMEEVHTNIPSTVERANVSGKKREAMLRAVAFSKARSGK